MKALIRKYLVLLPVAALLLVAPACDSDDNGGGDSDAELFVDTWAVSSVSDANGPADITQNFTGIAVTFTAAGAGTIAVTAVDPANSQTLNITYSLDESAKEIEINVSVPQLPTPIPLQMTYAFENDNNRVRFTASPSTGVLINTLFQTSLEGQVTLVVVRT